MTGYTGRYLEIDLTRRSARAKPLREELLRAYLGGRGLAVRLLWEALPRPGLSALSPDNVLVFANGPFTGLPVPGASRTSVVTKSPATAPLAGAAGASSLAIGQMPGHFAVELKYAGYDALVLRGAASEPLALILRDEDVEFRSAAELWGKEIPDAEQSLRADLPQEPYQIVAIGPAGENRMPLATAVHSHPYASHVGRGGIGAVMGAKHLKAIAVRGTLQPFDVAAPTRFEELSRSSVKALQAWPQFETWRRYGTACLVEAGSDRALLAVRNFREGSAPGVRGIGAVQAEAALWIRSEACFYCPLHCRKVGLIHRADGSGRAVAGPEFETSVMLGCNCGITDLEDVMRLKDRCDRLGLDPSSTGNLLGFLAECGERGLTTPSDLDGISPRWGDRDALLALVERVGRAQGVGSEIGQGVRLTAAAIGDGCQAWAMHVKGLEMDAYNVPALPAMVLVYGTSNTGGAHEHGHDIDTQNQRAVSDSLGLCRFHTYANPIATQADLLTAVTGAPWTPAVLTTTGERIWNLERAFNVREGFGAEDDRMPARCTRDAFSRGTGSGSVLSPEQEQQMLTNYYTQRGWDADTAQPLPETLSKLGLDDVADSLQAT